MNTIYCRVSKLAGHITGSHFQTWEVLSPISIVVGRGAAKKSLPGLLARHSLTKPFIVCDIRAAISETLLAIIRALDDAKLHHEVFTGVVSDPTTESVAACATAFSSSTCDCFLAFGGGSSIDTAKAASASLSNPVPLRKLKVNICVNATHGKQGAIQA